jgi:hypothetical protein
MNFTDWAWQRLGTPVADERRTHSRAGVVRPCKLQDLRSGKYYVGCTRDISQGGVLAEVRWPTNIAPGDDVALWVATDNRQILAQGDRILARVQRVLRGDAVLLALAFTPGQQPEQQPEQRAEQQADTHTEFKPARRNAA